MFTFEKNPKNKCLNIFSAGTDPSDKEQLVETNESALLTNSSEFQPMSTLLLVLLFVIGCTVLVFALILGVLCVRRAVLSKRQQQRQQRSAAQANGSSAVLVDGGNEAATVSGEGAVVVVGGGGGARGKEGIDHGPEWEDKKQKGIVKLAVLPVLRKKIFQTIGSDLKKNMQKALCYLNTCLLYTSPSPRD